MASDHRSQYPYLSDTDWNRYKATDELENVNKIRKSDLEYKFERFSLSKNKFNDESPSNTTEKNELRLVIIGKTGQGKSATANTILGKVRFTADCTAISVTNESKCVTELVDGRKIRVMDTPGLQDTNQSNKIILNELTRMTTVFPDGVHAFVYVMNMADPRFTAEDKNVLDLIEKTFGGGFKNYCLLVYSHGDSALKDVDLDTYRNKQMEIVQATSGHPTPQKASKEQKKHAQNQKNLSNFLGELSWKMIAVDNSTSVPLEKAHYRKQIVAMVDHMGTLNSPEIYTNDMFVKAQQEREDMRQKGLKKGWHPTVMSIVEELLAANPSISQEQLQVEVSQYVQKGNVKKSMELKRKQEEFEKRLQEQKRIDEEKREVEKKERREQLEKEDKVRKETFQREERERQEDRERKDREFQLKQEQLETERQNRIKDEEIERQRRVAEEKAESEKRVQLQMADWEKRKRAEEEDFETRRKHQQDILEDQLREDKQRRQEQEDEHLKRRKEEESTQIMQLEREAVIRRELEEKLLEIKKEELERQMKGKQEEQNILKRQEEERKQFERHLKEQREERLQEMEVFERNRKAKLDKQDLERQKKWEQDDMERQRKWEEEQAEKDHAEREKRQRAEEELHRLYTDIEEMERLQRERLLEEEVKEIQSEHKNIFSRSYDAVVNRAKQVKGWFTDLFY